ncbi:MAG TPA: hypothetical protein VNP20_16515 [Nocardioidaceae bacterium]|jgi:hypothetical protein|nr:hypothetical protein [Nocardioidaceae bacterium]
MFLPSTSLIGVLRMLLEARLQRARSQAGASAVEWVIIAAIVVGIAAAVGVILRNVLQSEAGEIANEIGNQ